MSGREDSGGEQPLVEPSARSDRRFQVWIALSGLAGALIGGGASYLGTSQQIDAQSEQDRTTFLRAERRDVYVDFLRAAQDARDAEEKVDLPLQVDSAPPDFADLAEARPELERFLRHTGAIEDALDELDDAQSRMQLVGEIETVVVARKLFDTHSDYAHAVTQTEFDGTGIIESAIKSGKFDVAPREQLEDIQREMDRLRLGLDGLSARVDRLTSEYVLAVRDELGANEDLYD